MRKREKGYNANGTELRFEHTEAGIRNKHKVRNCAPADVLFVIF